MNQKQDMLSIKEAQEELGVSRPTINRLLRTGKLRRFMKLGDNKAYVRADEVERLKEFEEK